MLLGLSHFFSGTVKYTIVHRIYTSCAAGVHGLLRDRTLSQTSRSCTLTSLVPAPVADCTRPSPGSEYVGGPASDDALRYDSPDLRRHFFFFLTKKSNRNMPLHQFPTTATNSNCAAYICFVSSSLLLADVAASTLLVNCQSRACLSQEQPHKGSHGRRGRVLREHGHGRRVR